MLYDKADFFLFTATIKLGYGRCKAGDYPEETAKKRHKEVKT